MTGRVRGERVLAGRRVTLEPIAAGARAEVDALDRRRGALPRTGHPFLRGLPQSSFAPPLAIRSNRGGTVVGTVGNWVVDAQRSVAELTLFVDPGLSRPGDALEAYLLYVEHLFARGARRLQLTVHGFDGPGLRILARLGVHGEARLHEHVYALGFFWDVVVFAFAREDVWRLEQVVRRG